MVCLSHGHAESLSYKSQGIYREPRIAKIDFSDPASLCRNSQAMYAVLTNLINLAAHNADRKLFWYTSM